MPNTSTFLKPCPFCGCATTQILDADTVNGHIFFANCDSCGANGPDADDLDQALELWNLRLGAHASSPLLCGGD